MTSRPSKALRSPVGPMTPPLYVPTGARVLRAKLQRLRADTRVVPHAHPWGQVALSAAGVVRVTAPHGSYIVPPSRGLDPARRRTCRHRHRRRGIADAPRAPAARSMRAGALDRRVDRLADMPRPRGLAAAARAGLRARCPARRRAGARLRRPGARTSSRRPAARRTAPGRAGAVGRRPATGQALASSVRSGHRRPVASRHAGGLGQRQRCQRAHAADGEHRRRARLCQRQRFHGDGAALGRAPPSRFLRP